MKQLEDAIRPDTALVSVMMVNNEIGEFLDLLLSWVKLHFCLVVDYLTIKISPIHNDPIMLWHHWCVLHGKVANMLPQNTKL